MNQVKSGTLIVIAMTVVTAVLILNTDRDSSSKPKSQKDVIETEKVEVSKSVKIENTASKEIKENSFISNSGEKVTAIPQKTEEIAAPEGPYNQPISQSEIMKVADKNNEIASENTKLAEQQAKDSIQVESINPVARSTQHELLNHINQPIWMDQKLGDFKSVDKGEIVFRIMPTSPDGLQGGNPQQVVTTKNDKFAATTIAADYNYQQMPMYNGGYFIAPMPPYLMESTLPMSEAVESK